jgi:hypothetical protein
MTEKLMVTSIPFWASTITIAGAAKGVVFTFFDSDCDHRAESERGRVGSRPIFATGVPTGLLIRSCPHLEDCCMLSATIHILYFSSECSGVRVDSNYECPTRKGLRINQPSVKSLTQMGFLNPGTLRDLIVLDGRIGSIHCRIGHRVVF